jgi:hypothetical protein
MISLGQEITWTASMVAVVVSRTCAEADCAEADCAEADPVEVVDQPQFAL